MDRLLKFAIGTIVFLLALCLIQASRADGPVCGGEDITIHVDRMLIPGQGSIPVGSMQELPRKGIARVSVVDGIQVLPEREDVQRTVVTFVSGLSVFMDTRAAFDFIVGCMGLDGQTT